MERVKATSGGTEVTLIDEASGLVVLGDALPCGARIVIDYPFCPAVKKQGRGRKGKRRGGRWWIR